MDHRGHVVEIAGADLLLQPADPAVTIDAVEAAVRSGRISEARLNVSVRRVLELKQRAGVFNRKLVDLDQVMLSVGGAESVDTARAIAQRAIVLVKDDGGIVDSLRARRGRRTLILYGDEVNVGAGNGLAAELRLRGDTLTTFRLTPSSGPASYDSARVALTRNPQAIIEVAALPYLGLGESDPAVAEWGRMLVAAQDRFEAAARLALLPGFAIALTALGFTLLGEAMREALDPRSRR